MARDRPRSLRRARLDGDAAPADRAARDGRHSRVAGPPRRSLGHRHAGSVPRAHRHRDDLRGCRRRAREGGRRPPCRRDGQPQRAGGARAVDLHDRIGARRALRRGSRARRARPLSPAAAAAAAHSRIGAADHGGQRHRRGARGAPERLALARAHVLARPRAPHDARAARGVPVRAARRQLRVLRGRARRDAPVGRYSVARGERLPARRVEPVRRLLGRAHAGCAFVGGGARERRVGDARSVAARRRAVGAAHRRHALHRRPAHALVPLRRRLEPPGPDGHGGGRAPDRVVVADDAADADGRLLGAADGAVRRGRDRDRRHARLERAPRARPGAAAQAPRFPISTCARSSGSRDAGCDRRRPRPRASSPCAPAPRCPRRRTRSHASRWPTNACASAVSGSRRRKRARSSRPPRASVGTAASRARTDDRAGGRAWPPDRPRLPERPSYADRRAPAARPIVRPPPASAGPRRDARRDRSAACR